ncbi:zf-HC2 domain-containing protein [Streptomyces sp. NPDC019396]|uniref:anti-sigma factor family protein n=1 Tax=Streptomyces sp. NPDC019396 TaxID=3154687 RepID=UPI003408244A
MSGIGPSPAEQHLGDRLAALIDGELKHDTRDRVLAHLATCPKCKAEADAQRRLKSVFAATAPPPPSEGFLARLQGLPGGPPGGQPADDSDHRGPFGGGRLPGGVFGVTPEGFGYAPGHGSRSEAGFRIHDVGRQEAERSVWRGRRFALTAASAVSFAAIALGGTLPMGPSGDGTARGDGRGNNVTPQRSVTPAQMSGTDGRRRGGGAAQQATGAGSASLAPVRPLSQPLMPSSLFSPTPPALIRPVDSVYQLADAHGPTPSASPRPTRLIAPRTR